MAFKNFRKGVNELREEGAVQILYDVDESRRDPILAAVGQLQLDVVQQIKSHPDRVGFVILKEKSKSQLMKKLNYFINRVKIVT